MEHKYETAVVISDLHIPYQDRRSVALVMDFLFEHTPDKIFLNGDIMDCFALSRFEKEPDKIAGAFKREVEETKDFLNRLRLACPDSEITYIFGNHEARLKSYLINKAPELFGFIDLESILELDKYKVKLIDSGLKESYVRYGKVIIGHFDIIRSHSAYTAKALVDRLGQTIIQAHSHRIGWYSKTAGNNQMEGVESGCLCLPGQYIANPNWQQGIVFIHKDKGNSEPFLQLLPIKNHKMFFGSEVYSA